MQPSSRRSNRVSTDLRCMKPETIWFRASPFKVRIPTSVRIQTESLRSEFRQNRTRTQCDTGRCRQDLCFHETVSRNGTSADCSWRTAVSCHRSAIHPVPPDCNARCFARRCHHLRPWDETQRIIERRPAQRSLSALKNFMIIKTGQSTTLSQPHGRGFS